MRTRRNSELFLSSALLLALCGSDAVAQAATAQDGKRGAANTLEEIIVTARKRSENLQSMPISVSAFSSEKLQKDDIRGLADLSRLVPSLSFQDQGAGQGQIAIRGIASAPVEGDEPKVKPSVGIYFNEVPVATARFNPDLNLFDVERVEVLRGPQGTLYGAGSLAGTIKIVTKQPDMANFDADLGAGIATTKSGDMGYSLDAMVNVPLVSDKFAVRAVASTRHTGGFIDNVARQDKDVNDASINSFRLTGKLVPNDRLSVTGIFLHQDMDTGGLGAHDTLVGGVDIGLNELQQYRGSREGVKDRFNLSNLVVEYDFGGFKLLSSTAYFDRRVGFDQDFTAGLDGLFGTGLPAPLKDTNNIDGFIQEARITSTGEQRLNWLGGVYFEQHDRRYQQSWPVAGFTAATGVPTGLFGTEDNLFESRLNFDERQLAVFGEVSYDLTPKLTATVGLRWFEFSQDFAIQAQGLFNGGLTGHSAKTESDDINPRFILSYQVNDNVLVSAQAAEGFRLGGTNDVVPVSICGADLAQLGLAAASEQYDSESLWNYELNAKTSWFDKRLVVNAALFHIDYSEIQASRRLNCGFGFTDNAGTAESRGVELEVFAVPATGMEVSLGGSYVDAKLTDDKSPIGEKGDRLPLHPRLSFNASIRQSFDLTDRWSGYASFRYEYVGEIISVLGYKTDPVLPQPLDAYSLGTVRLGVRTDKADISLYVTNLWDERVELYERSFLGNLQRNVYMNQPRTIGLNLRYGFGRGN